MSYQLSKLQQIDVVMLLNNLNSSYKNKEFSDTKIIVTLLKRWS
ncbi:617_t:CDS:2 [Dentiscutata erythropus]|uniref:617_t:CDS:1 n=1 Tax=Dentiscutata erythropus TaxID=1348616 RepID=A0A9N8ZTL0_9GLOM|nr:617_t:CDS:2 [Dentiscutata erythropus]